MPSEEHSPHDGCLQKLRRRIRKLPVLLIPGLLQAIAGLATFEYSYMIVKHTDFFNLSIYSIFFMILSGTSGVLAACCTQRRLGGALGRLSLQEYQRKSSNNLLHYRSLLLVGTALSFAFFVQGCYFLIDSQIHQEQADNVEPLSEIIYHESHPRNYWIYNPWSGYDDVFFPIDVKYHYISMVVIGAVFVQVLLFSAIFIHRIAKRRLAELDGQTLGDQLADGGTDCPTSRIMTGLNEGTRGNGSSSSEFSGHRATTTMETADLNSRNHADGNGRGLNQSEYSPLVLFGSPSENTHVYSGHRIAANGDAAAAARAPDLPPCYSAVVDSTALPLTATRGYSELGLEKKFPPT